VSCPSNSVVSLSGSTCKCNAGYSEVDGDPCIQCDATGYKIVIGSSPCLKCPINSVFDVLSTSVVQCKCDVGHTGIDGKACTPCATGTFKAVSRSAECLSCPHNSNFGEGSVHNTSCQCNAGFTGQNGASCTQCTAGKQKATMGSGNCESCLSMVILLFSRSMLSWALAVPFNVLTHLTSRGCSFPSSSHSESNSWSMGNTLSLSSR